MGVPASESKEDQLFPRLKESVRFRREDYCVFCMDRISEDMVALHPSEAVTLALCDGTRTAAEIVTTVEDAFAADPETSRRYFEAALEKVQRMVVYGTSRHARESALDPLEFVYNPIPFPTDRLPTYSGPLVVALSVTGRCNFRCSYCYRGEPQSGENELTTGQIHRIIDEAAALKVIRAFVAGGEPTLRPDLPEIVAHFLEVDILPYISTNGYLVTDRLARELARTGLGTIQVSLDCCDPTIQDRLTGIPRSFQAVVRAIEALKREGLEVRVKAVLTALNVEASPDLIGFCHKLGVNVLSFSPFMPGALGRREDELLCPPEHLLRAAELIEQSAGPYRDRMQVHGLTPYPKWQKGYSTRCGAMVSSIAISPHGDFGLCDLLEGVEEMAIGNMTEMSLMNAWFSEKAESWRDFDLSRAPEPCHSCPDVKGCRTGCFSFSKVCYGDYYAPDPRCAKAPRAPLGLPFMRTAIERTSDEYQEGVRLGGAGIERKTSCADGEKG